MKKVLIEKYRKYIDSNIEENEFFFFNGKQLLRILNGYITFV